MKRDSGKRNEREKSKFISPAAPKLGVLVRLPPFKSSNGSRRVIPYTTFIIVVFVLWRGLFDKSRSKMIHSSDRARAKGTGLVYQLMSTLRRVVQDGGRELRTCGAQKITTLDKSMFANAAAEEERMRI